LAQLHATLNKILDTFFHLPTLIILTLIGIVLVWRMYGVGFDFGHGFLRLNSNHGNVNLYWTNGCCELDW
jgi:hypothetical protein